MARIFRWYYAAVPIISLVVILWSVLSTPSWTGILPVEDGWSADPAADESHRFSGESDPNCKDFPHHRLTDIQVVLRVGSTQPLDQVLSHLNNVTNCISNLIIISDKEEQLGDTSHRTHDIIADLPEVYWHDESSDLQAHRRINNPESSDEPVTGRDGWLLDRFKFLPMVEYAFDQNEEAQWFYFVEADTYVVWDTLFRLLDRYDARKEWYIGSPSPGRKMENDKKTYFAYGGTGILLSRPAIKKLIYRKSDGVHGESAEPPLTEEWAQLVKDDCCGDSVLGFALANKGIFLSGLYPIFNPHPLHGIPFGPSGKQYWCQPVLSLHKSSLSDIPMLSKFLNRRPKDLPWLYADVLDYLHIADTTGTRQHWQNADWNGFDEEPDSPVHKSLEACAAGCHTHGECFQWTYHSKESWGREPSEKKCSFVRSIRLGSPKEPETTPKTRSTWTSGWDIASVKKWVNEMECADPEWVQPSVQRIY
ncbi:Chondroitin sulfate glucuronyltransferase [Talaromyces islandicus]|uniref:N-acetylgalactosaminide beta-1,3-galactosyltransferase n=1 Tax=Talaromyces islandicus TaxID=28573 RepID=A0A0U1LKR1_TALIS|nr:Chondroitin sulfate glucuronyltransferase [Talaromyces islandicus]